MTTFRTTFAAQVQAAIPAGSTRPVQVWVYDESRCGLHTIRRRRITARGTKPVGVIQQRFENEWLYGAIAPATGDAYFLGQVPRLATTYVQLFLDQFAAAHPDALHVILLDNSRCHTTRALRIPAQVVLLFQPPYSPEVNPAERVWQALKTALAWQRFDSLAALRDELVRLVRTYDHAAFQSLTSYPYILDAINAVSA